MYHSCFHGGTLALPVAEDVLACSRAPAAGGLAMNEGKLSTLLTTYGVILMGYSAWLYPPIQRWLGTKVGYLVYSHSC
jgi:hypothetical protein